MCRKKTGHVKNVVNNRNNNNNIGLGMAKIVKLFGTVPVRKIFVSVSNQKNLPNLY